MYTDQTVPKELGHRVIHQVISVVRVDPKINITFLVRLV